jgi:solute carrier family 25 citrate transporter 1
MIKTRMQGLAAARYSSTLDCLATVVREEGLLALYKGLAMRCARVVPGQGIIFCTYEVVSVRMRARLEAVG